MISNISEDKMLMIDIEQDLFWLSSEGKSSLENSNLAKIKSEFSIILMGDDFEESISETSSESINTTINTEEISYRTTPLPKVLSNLASFCQPIISC